MGSSGLTFTNLGVLNDAPAGVALAGTKPVDVEGYCLAGVR
jgi:hypothetical protein